MPSYFQSKIESVYKGNHKKLVSKIDKKLDYSQVSV